MGISGSRLDEEAAPIALVARGTGRFFLDGFEIIVAAPPALLALGARAAVEFVGRDRQMAHRASQLRRRWRQDAQLGVTAPHDGRDRSAEAVAGSNHKFWASRSDR